MSEKQVEVNIFPNPKKYLITMITNMAVEPNALTRLDMAEIMLDACREVMNISDLEVLTEGVQHENK